MTVVVMTACGSGGNNGNKSTVKWLSPTMAVSFSADSMDEDGDIDFDEVEFDEPLDFGGTSLGSSSGGIVRNQSAVGTPAELLEKGAIKVTVTFAYDGDKALFGRFNARIFAGDGQDDHYDPNYKYYGDITRNDIVILWNDGKNWFNINKNGGIGGFAGYTENVMPNANYTHSTIVPEEDLSGYEGLDYTAAGNTMLKITKTNAVQYASMDFYICGINLLEYDGRYNGVDGKNDEDTGYGYTFVFAFDGPSQHGDHLHFNGTNTLASTSCRIITGEHDHEH
jgi:hypothetical protein